MNNNANNQDHISISSNDDAQDYHSIQSNDDNQSIISNDSSIIFKYERTERTEDIPEFTEDMSYHRSKRNTDNYNNSKYGSDVVLIDTFIGRILYNYNLMIVDDRDWIYESCFSKFYVDEDQECYLLDEQIETYDNDEEFENEEGEYTGSYNYISANDIKMFNDKSDKTCVFCLEDIGCIRETETEYLCDTYFARPNVAYGSKCNHCFHKSCLRNYHENIQKSHIERELAYGEELEDIKKITNFKCPCCRTAYRVAIHIDSMWRYHYES